MPLPVDPADSPLFTPWRDPRSGVVSHVLTTRVAHSHQSFYFTSPPEGSGGLMWIYASDPPTPGHHLGLLDLAAGTATAFPRTGFVAESAHVDPVTGEVFWAAGTSVYRCAPTPGAEPVLVGQAPAELAEGRDIRQISTHLTRSADGRWINLDLKIGRNWYLGGLDLDDDGSFTLWHTFDRHVNHSQFSPTDPKLIMFAQDWWHDIVTGEAHGWDNRIWLLELGGEPRPLYDDPQSIQAWNHCHEWWDRDGSGIWYVDYRHGTYRHDLASDTRELVWAGPHTHSQSSADGRRLVADINTYRTDPDAPCRLAFHDRDSDAEIDIVSDMPFPDPSFGPYHWHPHPQFVLDDEWISYTTTVHPGRLDVALTRVADLLP